MTADYPIWRLVNTGCKDPFANMSIDEALVQTMGQDDSPILRFFDWASPCISIGFSQRIDDVLNCALCHQDGIPFVRRPTGGGVVFHGCDITYSVILPKGFIRDIYEGYRLIQPNILNGLKSIGIDATLYEKIEKADLRSHCFVTPNFGDIIVGGRKICGLAARRIKQKFLYQGYIYFDDAADLVKYVNPVRGRPAEGTATAALGRSASNGVKGISAFESKSAYVRLFCKDADRETVKQGIIKNWPSKFIESGLNDKEEEFAEGINNKYSSDEWNCKR